MHPRLPAKQLSQSVRQLQGRVGGGQGTTADMYSGKSAPHSKHVKLHI